MPHSCFIHSSTDGRLVCFQSLAIINNAAINIGVLIFFQISISISIFNFFLFLFFYLFLQRGREGEREGEKHQCVVASHITTTGDLAGNPGDPWVWRPALDPLSHTSQGHFKFFEVYPHCFPQWLHQSALLTTVQKGSPFSIYVESNELTELTSKIETDS